MPVIRCGKVLEAGLHFVKETWYDMGTSLLHITNTAFLYHLWNLRALQWIWGLLFICFNLFGDHCIFFLLWILLASMANDNSSFVIRKIKDLSYVCRVAAVGSAVAMFRELTKSHPFFFLFLIVEYPYNKHLCCPVLKVIAPLVIELAGWGVLFCWLALQNTNLSETLVLIPEHLAFKLRAHKRKM